MCIDKVKASSVSLLLAAGLLLTTAATANSGTHEDKLTLLARSRQAIPGAAGEFRVLSNKLNWAPSQCKRR